MSAVNDAPVAALSAEVRAEIDRWVAKFPPDRRRSAVIAALHALQHEHGHLTQDGMDAVASYLGLPPIQVYEVASFYSMFETQLVGRHHISVCTNISCMLCGGEELVVRRTYGVVLHAASLPAPPCPGNAISALSGGPARSRCGPGSWASPGSW